MRADLVALGIRPDWIGVDNTGQTAVETVMEHLRDEGGGVLLIFDNAIDVDAVKAISPARRSGTRMPGAASRAPVEIGVWPRDIATAYLIAQTGRGTERTEAGQLSKVLGSLLLAHAGGGLLRAARNISKRFKTRREQYLGDAGYAPTEHHDGLTVSKTFGFAIDEAAKRHPAAEPLVVYAALLAPEPIPLFLFVETREAFGGDLILDARRRRN